jgi:hypothetical protein
MPPFLKKRFYVCLQPRLFVGRGMHEGAFSLFKYVSLLTHLHIVLPCVTCFSITEHCCPDRYTMFWVLLLATKLTVSFYIEVTFIFLYHVHSTITDGCCISVSLNMKFSLFNCRLIIKEEKQIDKSLLSIDLDCPRCDFCDFGGWKTDNVETRNDKSHIILLVRGSLLAKYDLPAQLHANLWFGMNFGLPSSCLDFFSHKSQVQLPTRSYSLIRFRCIKC